MRIRILCLNVTIVFAQYNYEGKEENLDKAMKNTKFSNLMSDKCHLCASRRVKK